MQFVLYHTIIYIVLYKYILYAICILEQKCEKRLKMYSEYVMNSGNEIDENLEYLVNSEIEFQQFSLNFDILSSFPLLCDSILSCCVSISYSNLVSSIDFLRS